MGGERGRGGEGQGGGEGVRVLAGLQSKADEEEGLQSLSCSQTNL